MQKSKIILICFILIISSLLLAGCFKSSILKNSGNLSIQIDIPNELLPQFQDNEFTLTEFIITISQGDQIYTQTLTPGNQQIATTFSNLIIGNWDIEVIAKDEDGFSIYSAHDTANITHLNTTSVAMELEFTPGQLDVEVLLPQSSNIASGTVTLTDPTNQENQVTQNLTIGNTSGTTSFSDIQSIVWTIKVEIFDSNGDSLSNGNSYINILPGRSVSTQITLSGDGGLQLDFELFTPPSKPTGLSATCNASTINLSWNPNPEDNIYGYAIYRSDSETGYKTPVGYSISIPRYPDNDNDDKEVNWYWVQAYDANGYSSELSDPIMVINDDKNYKICFRIYYEENYIISTMNLDGSEYLELANNDLYGLPNISPDGQQIAVSENGSGRTIHFINTDGSGMTSLPTSIFELIQPGYIEWSPDGSKIIFSDHLSDYTNGHNLNIIDLDADIQYMLTNYSSVDPHPSEQKWSPDGSTIAYVLYNNYDSYDRNNRFWELYLINASTGTDNHRLTNNTRVTGLSWSPDGSKIAFYDYDSTFTTVDFYTINADGTDKCLLYTGNICGYSWSPDGTQIIFIHRPQYSTFYTLAIINSDGTGYKTFPFDQVVISEVCWVPNGQIIFSLKGDYGYDIMRCNSNGTGMTKILDSNQAGYTPGYISSMSIYTTQN
ncbi:MAG: PD40 domain-containing protein [Halanaerobiales bacterium]|nr:PD40 domain-containing protein [Halanaerobiales bacterium]